MKKTKQQKVLEILKGNKYQITDGGSVLSFRKCDNEYVELSSTVLSFGFVQVILHPGKVNVYMHNLVWLNFCGEFKDSEVIRHKDGNRSNNSLNNLYIDSLEVDESPEDGRLKKSDIDNIKTMIANYPSRSASSIARELGLKDQSVRYTVRKIKNGSVFRFNEHGCQVSNDHSAATKRRLTINEANEEVIRQEGPPENDVQRAILQEGSDEINQEQRSL